MSPSGSVGNDRSDAGGERSGNAISGDGRRVVFVSYATNLTRDRVLANTYVRDLAAGKTQLVSRATSGAIANGPSFDAAISTDGSHVAFTSTATNLAKGTSGEQHVFVRDLAAGTTKLASVTSGGAPGRGGYCTSLALSATGRFVAMRCSMANLVPGDTNRLDDVFEHDMVTGRTVRVSVATDGTQADAGSDAPSVSADGRLVAFGSAADNLVAGAPGGVFLRDVPAGKTVLLSRTRSGAPDPGFAGGPSMTPDGRYVAYSTASPVARGDTNATYDVVVLDRSTGTLTRASTTMSGGTPNDYSVGASLSPSARYVAFLSVATNMGIPTAGGIHAYVHDLTTNVTRRVDLSTQGESGNQYVTNAFVSCNGSVAFTSHAGNLVPRDDNGSNDVFVRRPA